MSEKAQAALYFSLFGLAVGLFIGSIVVGLGVPYGFVAIPAMIAMCVLLYWQ